MVRYCRYKRFFFSWILVLIRFQFLLGDITQSHSFFSCKCYCARHNKARGVTLRPLCFRVQDVCLILAVAALFLSFFSTYVFQVRNVVFSLTGFYCITLEESFYMWNPGFKEKCYPKFGKIL